MTHALRWFPSSWLVLSCLLCSFFLHKCDALLFLHRNQNYFSYTSIKCTIRLVCFSYEEEKFCHQKVQDIKFLLHRKIKYWKGLKIFLWMIWTWVDRGTKWHVLIFKNMQQHQQLGWSWFQTYSCNSSDQQSILQLHAWLPSLWTGVRLWVTLLWYKPCYFSNVNDFVIMLTRYWSPSQHGQLQPHSKSKARQVSTQL